MAQRSLSPAQGLASPELVRVAWQEGTQRIQKLPSETGDGPREGCSGCWRNPLRPWPLPGLQGSSWLTHPTQKQTRLHLLIHSTMGQPLC